MTLHYRGLTRTDVTSLAHAALMEAAGVLALDAGFLFEEGMLEEMLGRLNCASFTGALKINFGPRVSREPASSGRVT